jgi:hypothetical protein
MLEKVAQLGASGNMQRDGQVSPDGYAVNTSRSIFLKVDARLRFRS